jgi:hypothetical protein
MARAVAFRKLPKIALRQKAQQLQVKVLAGIHLLTPVLSVIGHQMNTMKINAIVAWLRMSLRQQQIAPKIPAL